MKKLKRVHRKEQLALAEDDWRHLAFREQRPRSHSLRARLFRLHRLYQCNQLVQFPECEDFCRLNSTIVRLNKTSQNREDRKHRESFEVDVLETRRHPKVNRTGSACGARLLDSFCSCLLSCLVKIAIRNLSRFLKIGSRIQNSSESSCPVVPSGCPGDSATSSA
ncbi:hypothetical protein KOR42_20470 [Thalassoglobus neptunius]|uniref:Uncharacterized protein n=1 Tax=Thalassoglobus neptunius TaxID=1938619 RepID=A0A5C5X939_9PLAN|nr:hypothetical protein KOR42_20470 [Thalassoglobus neptunius]